MMNYDYTDTVHVELIDRMGDDESVIQAAKVSTNTDYSVAGMSDEAKQKFIDFLMSNRHGSPFESIVFKFRIEVPIFVVRELMRHRIASYNEISGRYTQLEPNFYIFGRDRKIVQKGKPGAYTFELGADDQYIFLNNKIISSYQYAYSTYLELLEAGIAKEAARVVLPVGIFTSLYMTINSRSLMNLLSLRVKDDNSLFPSYPQREIEMMAEKMEEAFKHYAPLTHESFVKNRRVAP